MGNEKCYKVINELTPSYWRIGQFWTNFQDWHKKTYGNDTYYIENDKLLQRIEKFLAEVGINSQIKDLI